RGPRPAGRVRHRQPRPGHRPSALVRRARHLRGRAAAGDAVDVPGLWDGPSEVRRRPRRARPGRRRSGGQDRPDAQLKHTARENSDGDSDEDKQGEREIERDPRKRMVNFRVHTAWRGPRSSASRSRRWRSAPRASWICAASWESMRASRPATRRSAIPVRLKGGGTPEQYREIHEAAIRTSPNYFNMSRPIRIDAKLEVE